MNEGKTNVKKVILNRLFDFFMLFLAVTLGFMADNFRDDRKSENLAHELAGDIVQDIRSDSLHIHEMLKDCNIKKIKLDSLFYLIDDEMEAVPDSMIYQCSAYIHRRPWFEKHNSTYALLINSGDLSIFTKEASVAICNYDEECQKIVAYLEQEKQIISTKIHPFQQQVFHIENFNSIVNANTFICKPELRNWNPEARWLYHNYVTELIYINNKIILHYQHLLEKAGQTISILNKKYIRNS